MTAIFYDNEKKPVKTVHFGATGYPDYAISPHDEERKNRYIKRHKTKRKLERLYDRRRSIKIYIMGTYRLEHCC